MQLRGILETALYVDDVKRAARFYRELFDFETLFENERLVALDVAGRNVLLLFAAGATEEPFTTPGVVIPPHGPAGRSHFAFSIASGDVEGWKSHLASKGVEVESLVRWPGGAESIYFRDPDGNLAELITPGFWKSY